MRSFASLFCLTLFVGLCACSDDDKPAVDSAPPAGDKGLKDGGSPEAVKWDGGPVADSGSLSGVGFPCTKAADCKKESPLCVEGICTVSCETTDCPDKTKQVCASVTVNNQDQYYCLLRCTPNDTSNPCPKGSNTACTPDSVYYAEAYDEAVCWEEPCTQDADCPVDIGKTCNPTNGDKDCATGHTCSSLTATTGRCKAPGKCNTPSGLCKAHALGKAGAKIGDICKSDKDCANDQSCYLEEVDAGITTARNGYCVKSGCTFAKTLTSAACPTGSGCNRAYYGGLCQKKCTLTDKTSCRGQAKDFLGDYECYAWDNINLGTVDVSDSPLCDLAPLTPCDIYQDDALECKDFGDATNSTKMSCRGLDNKVKSNKFDPAGFCLDDTASGPIK